MLQTLKKILCLHQFEYEIDATATVKKECRKCGVCH